MKYIITAALLFVSIFTMAQDTLSVSITDKSKNYVYTNVYSIISSVSINPPDPLLAVANPNYNKWQSIVHISTYATKNDYKAGKNPLFSNDSPIIYTPNFPLSVEIFNQISNAVKIISQ